ncbi:MAG: threonine--tRNA ligase [Dehalococcoidia bacterium]|nr:threonine--tRNA ligase [Dehalococcoidia bacterium]
MPADSPSHINPSDLAAYRHRLRHSVSHVMASAVVELFPEAKLAIGPPTEDGFYYDFLVSRPFSPEDLQAIEERMRRDIAVSIPFQRKELSRVEAEGQFAAQPFKLELIAGIPADEPISTYRHGIFEDLCEGPHVESTADIKAFKLLSVAGAYWRGDEKRPMLQRIYGTAFESQDALDEHLHRLEEAQRRDHRVLGRELGLFFFDPLAPASPFFMPKGALVYNLLVEYMRSLYKRYGYQEVITPQIFGTDLWKRSGHYDNYIDNMYLINAEEREYGVKPMNCPAHCLMYMNQRHSYRELPIRYADFGRLHRFERSGVTHGLTRVRSFSQDDAHIFCRMEQVNQEIADVLAMTRESFSACGLGEPRFTLSMRPEKRLGTDEMWDRAEAALRDALLASGYSFTEVPGEGAFYGPKIDMFAKDAIGREWQLSTIQLDINLPERFDLEYVAEDGSFQRPVIVHRAVLGSIERFLGVLIEHHAGAFPVWLAPVQAVVIPIADRHIEYASQVAARLESEGVRVSMDATNERMNAKVRNAQLQKIPYMLIVGDREAANSSVSVRLRSGENPGSMPLDKAVARIKEAIASRS